MNLEELAIKHGTDKKCEEGHGYTPFYEKYFEPLRNETVKLMELGVHEGWSMNMWVEYFPNGEFWGIDNDKEGLCPKDFNNDMIHFHLGSQDDELFLKSVCGENKFDIIIDDCSHISKLSIRSFDILFPYLKEGGIYVIEDLHTWKLFEYNPEMFSLNQISSSEIADKTMFLEKIMFIRKRG